MVQHFRLANAKSDPLEQTVKAMWTPEYCPQQKSKDGARGIHNRSTHWFLKFPERNELPSKPATLHDAINMARELIEQGVQAKALRIRDSNKRKWEDQQGNNHHQQQNRRQKAAKAHHHRSVSSLGVVHGHKLCHAVKGIGRTRIPVARDNSKQNGDMLWLWESRALQE
ncbi:hypothetical protein Tco_1394999 [Tanacetum coccineum]